MGSSASRSRRRSAPQRTVQDVLFGGIGAVELTANPAVTHHENAVAQPRISGSSDEIMTMAAPRESSSPISRYTSILPPTSMPRVGSSKRNSSAFVVEPLRDHDLLLVSAAQLEHALLEIGVADAKRRDVACARCFARRRSRIPLREKCRSALITTFSPTDKDAKIPWRLRSSGTSATPVASRRRVFAPSPAGRGGRCDRCRSGRRRRSRARSRSLPAPTRPAMPTISPRRTPKLIP